MSETKLILRQALENALEKEWGNIHKGVGMNGEDRPDFKTIKPRIVTAVIRALCELKTGSKLAKDKEGRFSWAESEKVI